ncbi:MAG: hypothetical protein ACTSO7_16570 [Candidatus Heimdallarchaeota archaeon]
MMEEPEKKLNNRTTLMRKLNLSFDIISLILGVVAIASLILFPFANWSHIGMTHSAVLFGFPHLYGYESYLPWIYNYIWALFVLLCLCFLLIIFTLTHTLDKNPMLKSKMMHNIIGLALSVAIVILTSLMAIFFFQYSADLLTYERYGLSISYYTSLIFACIVFSFSLTRLILSFKRKPTLVKS